MRELRRDEGGLAIDVAFITPPLLNAEGDRIVPGPVVTGLRDLE